MQMKSIEIVDQVQKKNPFSNAALMARIRERLGKGSRWRKYKDGTVRYVFWGLCVDVGVVEDSDPWGGCDVRCYHISDGAHGDGVRPQNWAELECVLDQALTERVAKRGDLGL